MDEDHNELTIPMWRWFFTKKGLPALVGIMTLVASVTFNIVQFRHDRAPQILDFEAVGSFRSGALMDAIIQQCKEGIDAPTVPPLQIVADMAGYGTFSHPDKAQDYLDVLRKRANRGKNNVSCIFLDEQRRRDAFVLQLQEFDADIKTKPFQEKLEKFMASGYGRRALRELNLEHKALKPETVTKQEFVEIAIKEDNLIIKDLLDWGIRVKYYPHLLTVHAWSGIRNQVLTAIVDFEGATDEAGFLTRGHIAQNIQKIFEIMESGSKP